MANKKTPNPLVKTFQRICYEYLKPQERERLILCLKRFERSRDVVELAETMVTILDTPEKSSTIYPVVNELIPVSCRRSYQEILQKRLSRQDGVQLPNNIPNGISVLQSPENSVRTSTASVETSDCNTISLQKVIHLARCPKDGTNVGFRLSYTDIGGPGFLINSLEQSFAEWTDLEVGDKLVAVNDIPVDNWQMTADQLVNVVAGQRQQSLGVDIHIQRLMFNPEKLTAGSSCSVQDVGWYDIASMRFDRKHKPKWPSQLRHARMKMQDSTTGRMGLNIRGGREFSCGIYISKIERGGLAERCGLRVGDQILTVNGITMIDVPYRLACRHMAYENTLDFAVRYTGQFPIYTDPPRNRAKDLRSDVSNSSHDTSQQKQVEMKHPYSNGRVDPIGSCSPGMNNSYEISSLKNEDRRQKSLFTDTASIQNPLCNYESSLLNSIPITPSSEQTSVKTIEFQEEPGINQLRTPKMDESETPPKPPPRTGKPDMEKVNQLLSKRKEAANKQHQPSIVGKENADSKSSKTEVKKKPIDNQTDGDNTKPKTSENQDCLKPVSQIELESNASRNSRRDSGSQGSSKVEITAIVHQPAEDVPKPPNIDEDLIKPVDQKIVKSKPPRKRMKSIETNKCDVKSTPESRNEKNLETKPALLQKPQGLNMEPNSGDTEKNNIKVEKIEPTQVEQIEPAKQKPVTETACPRVPSIFVQPESVSIPEIFVGSECNNLEHPTERESIIAPLNYVKAESTVELELLSVNCSDNSTCDDDDRLSYVSSLSLEYDGDHFTVKSPHAESKDEISPKGKFDRKDEEQLDKNSVLYKVRQLENRFNEKKAEWRLAGGNRDVTEPVSPLPEKPKEVIVPPVTTAPVTIPSSPSPSSISSSQNSERGSNTRSKRRSEEARFPHAVNRTISILASSTDEDSENNQLQMLMKMASFILNKEEMKSIMQYIREYLERNDVEQLVSRLLEVLDNPEKQLLLNQIRELVSPFDRGRFDSMLSVHGNINFQNADMELLNDKGERGRRPGLKEEQSLLARVQCRRKQLDAQMELLEHLRKAKPKVYKHKEEDLSLITVYVSKNVRNLDIYHPIGISVTGGADCKKQQALIIEEVHTGGAAAETKRITPGMTLVSVDDEDLETASHKAAVYTIRKAFTDRKKPYMKLVLRKPADVERWPTS